MGTVTLKDLNQRIDVSLVQTQARGKWEKRERGRLSLEHRILNLLPIGLVVMVAVFYSLSAPHTAHILNMVTPGWGVIAPIGFEIGLLIISALIEAGWKARIMYMVLGLLLVMSVVINIAASFLVVVAVSPVVGGDISTYTFQELLGLYPTLPASVQVVILMVVPVGFTIPVVTKLAGEAVTKLALGKVTLNSRSVDDLWARVEQHEVKSALMQAAREKGAGVKTAGRWASLVVEQIYGDTQSMSAIGSVGSVGNSQIDGRKHAYAFHEMHSQQAKIDDNSQFPIPIGNSLSPKMAVAVRWLEEHPEDMQIPGRELEQQRAPDGNRLSYRTWNDAKKLVK